MGCSKHDISIIVTQKFPQRPDSDEKALYKISLAKPGPKYVLSSLEGSGIFSWNRRYESVIDTRIISNVFNSFRVLGYVTVPELTCFGPGFQPLMKQILQNQKTGVTEIAEVPCPQLKAGHVLIRNRTTLISAGTERTVVDFGKANLIEKARQNPEKVRMLLDRLKTNGLLHTVEAATHKLEQRIALGYCSAGVVLDVGHGVTGISKGDRVASNGKHAEVVSVPLNLCVKIADEVSYDEAAFTVIGAIGLQGVRLAQPTLGESFVVTGLGLVGLVTVQFLLANGCRVLGIDVDAHKLSLARQFGAQTLDVSAGQNPVTEAMAFSRGRGVDGVIITAATKSNEPVHQAAQMCRKRGRIVLVGVVGLELSRDDFYEKELSFQVSCSYGPGRYDPLYEEGGHDYPIGFVRWTEQRNLEAMMDLLEGRKVDVNSLISHRFPLERAADAYGLLTGGDPYLGILLEYSGDEERSDDILLTRTIQTQRAGFEPPGY